MITYRLCDYESFIEESSFINRPKVWAYGRCELENEKKEQFFINKNQRGIDISYINSY